MQLWGRGEHGPFAGAQQARAAETLGQEGLQTCTLVPETTEQLSGSVRDAAPSLAVLLPRFSCHIYSLTIRRSDFMTSV